MFWKGGLEIGFKIKFLGKSYNILEVKKINKKKSIDF